jgi:hypothetical protein
MSHFAEIDENGVVLRVIVAEQDFIDSGALGPASRWVQTSYSGSFRKRFAAPGFTYDDRIRDAFLPPKPFPSWVLDDDTLDWVAPIAVPDEGGPYDWDEGAGDWRPTPPI